MLKWVCLLCCPSLFLFQASLVMYELACKLNRDGNEVVWPAIVGLTEQLLYEKITTEVYWDSAFKLEQSVRRHNRG